MEFLYSGNKKKLNFLAESIPAQAVTSGESQSSVGSVTLPNEEKILKHFGVADRGQLMELKQMKFLTSEHLSAVPQYRRSIMRFEFGDYRGKNFLELYSLHRKIEAFLGGGGYPTF